MAHPVCGFGIHTPVKFPDRDVAPRTPYQKSQVLAGTSLFQEAIDGRDDFARVRLDDETFAPASIPALLSDS